MIGVISDSEGSPLRVFCPLTPPMVGILENRFLGESGGVRVDYISERSVGSGLRCGRDLIRRVVVRGTVELGRRTLRGLKVASGSPRATRRCGTRLRGRGGLGRTGGGFRSCGRGVRL